MKQAPALPGYLSAAAHLIHGNSEGRFRIVNYPDPGVLREEIESEGLCKYPTRKPSNGGIRPDKTPAGKPTRSTAISTA
jgi:hypothetical protein